MTLNEYQANAKKTALYPNAGNNFVYPTLGLASEAGEVANKVKKIIRDDGNSLTEEKRSEIAAELGDVLWYVAQLSTELNLPLEEVGRQNIEKLASRHSRGVLGGSGDSR